MRVRLFVFPVCAVVLLSCGSSERKTQSDAALATKSPTAPAPAAAAFEQTMELQGVRFKVSSPNSASSNKLSITPSGLEGDNAPILHDVNGTVQRAEVADLNVDGSPEIYVYVASTDSGSHGTLVAYSANNRKSLSEIYLPPVAENSKAAAGYRGHDEFAVVENTFVQRFPIYGEGSADAKPSGKMRQLQYKLKQGEAGWVLRLDRTVEF